MEPSSCHSEGMGAAFRKQERGISGRVQQRTGKQFWSRYSKEAAPGSTWSELG